MLTRIILLCLIWTISFAETLPQVQVKNIRRVFHNGEHNAFTDLVKFKGKYYLTFRSCPDGHMLHPTSTIIVMESTDTKEWKQVFRFNVEKRDVRDPHFLVFKEKLFVYTGTWFCGDTSPNSADRDLNEHLGYGVWSEDGQNWNGPTMLEGTYGHYIWRAAEYDGKAYLCGRRKRNFVKASRTDRSLIQSAMLESDDGLIWRKKALFQETEGDETAFLFEPNGSVVAVARRGRGNAELCISNPPYTKWKRSDLGRYIGGPHVAKWNDNYLVAGRKIVDKKYTTCFYWLNGTELVQFAELPSDGDNSYPGFVQTGPNKALISWYSSHEKNKSGEKVTAIYLAELEMD